MLQDPEKDKEVWTDYVWADTEVQATKLCEIKAEQATLEGRTVVRLIGQPKRVGKGKRYECTFEGEVYNA